MIKRILIIIVLICLMTTLVQAKGLTLWTGTDQLTEVDQEKNAIYGRIGWSFTENNEGLEIAIGSTWYKSDANPQVMSLCIIEHLPDLIDPDGLPWIKDLLLAVVTEEVVMAPYVGATGTFQFIDKNAGMFGIIGGVKIKVTPKSKTEWVVEGSYINPFGDLEGVKKAKLAFFLRIPF